MATSSAAAAAAATTGGSSDIWGDLEKQKVGGIGGSIPGAGVYLQQQAQAELAFNNAKAQLTAQKNRAFSQFGLTSEGAVDPMSQYGGYQQLLHNHAVDLMGASEHSVQRGLGAGSGLANQEEANLRYGQNAEDLDFQRGVADQESQYTQGAQGALQTRNAAFLDAQMQALANAISQNAFAPAGGVGGEGGGIGNSADWLYGSSLPQGVSGESVYSTALQYAPIYNGVRFVPGHIMNQGQIVNGKIAVKFQDPTGQSNGDTIWIPVSQGDSGGGSVAPTVAQTRQNAPGTRAPISTPITLPKPAPKKAPAKKKN